jgi:hypothetical protein
MPGFTDFVSRIQTDYAFYLQFRQNPREALASYKLSSEEQASVTAGGRQLWSQLGRFRMADLKGAVAIARHCHAGSVRADDIKATAF